MTINDQIKDEKLQYDINREAAKTSALSSGKLQKYLIKTSFLTGENILASNQQQIIEQTKFTYSSLGKAFEKQTKTIEGHGKKQVDALENLKPIEGSKATKYDDDESLEQKQETCNKLFDEKLDES